MNRHWVAFSVGVILGAWLGLMTYVMQIEFELPIFPP